MADDHDISPQAPAGGGGPGNFCSPQVLGQNPDMDQHKAPGPHGCKGQESVSLTIPIVIAEGGPLSNKTTKAVNKVAERTPAQWRRCIAYKDEVKVGGSLAWRANNPGNLRDAPTKIASTKGAVGKFAVFATLKDGREAQRALYLNKYGDMKVRDAINKLTPPSENDTTKYLADLKAAGVDLDKDVKSQIDPLMKGVEANEGLIEGTEVEREPDN